jgi:hypothetical protein
MGARVSAYEDEDGVDGAFERAMRSAEREDERLKRRAHQRRERLAERLCECAGAELGVEHLCTALPTCAGEGMMPLDEPLGVLTLDEVCS